MGIPACANTVNLNGDTFLRQKYDDQGQHLYKSSLTGNYLFYTTKWMVAEGFTDSQPILEAQPCPEESVTFTGITKEMPDSKLKKWRECSDLCWNVDKCSYWRYSNTTELCTLITGFNGTTAAAEGTYSGSRDCPGNVHTWPKLCVENMGSRSMWKRGAEEYFAKDVRAESGDETAVLVTGYSSFTSEVLLANCSVPDVPKYD